MENSKISGLIITYNEEELVDDVIENISFVDELIVVDSFSTDKTISKLNKYNHVKVVQRNFKNFSDQRNFAIQQAQYPWILFIDADERITKELRSEILETVSNPSIEVAFKFPRKFVFGDKLIKFSGLQTDFIYRLFKKGFAQYNLDQTVHEKLEVNGKSKTLSNVMLHYSYSDYESYKKKTEHYAILKAQELFEQGKKPTFFDFYIKPAYKFLYNYIFRLGVLDGKAGYIICKLNAYGVKYRFKKLEKLISSSPKK
ncbi:glycosyltransferase family 2 protein [Yeosuana sp. MJ-SS3]|uniref:Glycosyltransferase family 2 protein n=1 Tax=Gilvirhabdus luticola TaxID=3079858 RepID=A0ABU3U6R8_9FLAO|nr:glycosyltransferase family 2 protein [Yeosuana sp. MJ-SS3]MDU8886108.1 glycosyltransferase family 2 protein [Yeosuana sp. MJ-SS3]